MAAVPPGTPGALSGVRVLDFSFVMAGPYCTRLMADLGADVVKVEARHGDLVRGRPPLRDGRSSYFAALNCGKRSIVLDLKHDEGRRVAQALARQSDVVIENFRPGVMKRLGLDYDTLAAQHPRLVYCSISGFGQGASGDGKGAYAPTLHALSGYDHAMRTYQAVGRDAPDGGGGRPPNTGLFVADVLGGSLAFGAINAALLQRERTGRGEHVDLSLLDAMIGLQVCELQEAQFPEQPMHFVYQPTRTRDGWLMVAPTTQENFAALCRATGRLEWLEDERFRSGAARQRHWGEFLAALEARAARRTAAECERILDAHQVPCSRYLPIGEAIALPSVAERGSVREVDDGAGPFLIAGAPYRMRHGTAAPRDHLSTLGGDGAAVLRELLRMTDADVQRLRETGALGGG
jgi:crotonobetainyl-CoA:carnitine CoA-transferase CaiB-like acyl-CoA transferase